MSQKTPIIRTISDPEGNFIRSYDHGDLIQVFLKLRSESSARRLGYIRPAQRILELERNRSRHLHQKSNSYGLNYELIKQSTRFDTIRIIDEFGVYDLPKDIALSNGKFLFFKQEGFERQLFIPLTLLTQYQKTKK